MREEITMPRTEIKLIAIRMGHNYTECYMLKRLIVLKVGISVRYQMATQYQNTSQQTVWLRFLRNLQCFVDTQVS